jgi:hypothetical protein
MLVCMIFTTPPYLGVSNDGKKSGNSYYTADSIYHNRRPPVGSAAIAFTTFRLFGLTDPIPQNNKQSLGHHPITPTARFFPLGRSR